MGKVDGCTCVPERWAASDAWGAAKSSLGSRKVSAGGELAVLVQLANAEISQRHGGHVVGEEAGEVQHVDHSPTPC